MSRIFFAEPVFTPRDAQPSAARPPPTLKRAAPDGTVPPLSAPTVAFELGKPARVPAEKPLRSKGKKLFPLQKNPCCGRSGHIYLFYLCQPGLSVVVVTISQTTLCHDSLSCHCCLFGKLQRASCTTPQTKHSLSIRKCLTHRKMRNRAPRRLLRILRNNDCAHQNQSAGSQTFGGHSVEGEKLVLQ